jgi:hypothetical protein
MVQKFGRRRVQIKEFGWRSEASVGVAVRAGEREGKGVGVGMATRFGRGKGGVKDRKGQNGGS